MLYFFQKFVFIESQIETKCGRDLCSENGDGIFFKTGVTRFPCSGARPDQSQRFVETEARSERGDIEIWGGEERN